MATKLPKMLKLSPAVIAGGGFHATIECILRVGLVFGVAKGKPHISRSFGLAQRELGRFAPQISRFGMG